MRCMLRLIRGVGPQGANLLGTVKNLAHFQTVIGPAFGVATRPAALDPCSGATTHSLSVECFSLAVTSMREDFPSGKAPTRASADFAVQALDGVVGVNGALMSVREPSACQGLGMRVADDLGSLPGFHDK